MNVQRFFVLSIVVHIVLFIGIYFIPIDKTKERKEFITKLVTPEELKKIEIIPPKPKIKFPPPLPPDFKKPTLPREMPARHPELAPEKIIVPGEGTGTGRPLPKGADQIVGNRQGEETAKDKLSKSKPLEKPGYFEKQKLFDRDVIDEIAKKGIPEKKKKDRAITFDTSEYKYMGYISLLKGRFESSGCWVYPPEAAERGNHGVVIVRFAINKNGRLGAVELFRTSGHKVLDDEVMRALRDCGPYWALPDAWDMDNFLLEFHFEYASSGFYIR